MRGLRELGLAAVAVARREADDNDRRQTGREQLRQEPVRPVRSSAEDPRRPAGGYRLLRTAIHLLRSPGGPGLRRGPLSRLGALGRGCGGPLAPRERDLRPWVEDAGGPGRPASVFDVGCGRGDTLRYLREAWPDGRFAGMEP